MPAAERQSPWASGERRPHFFKVLMGDFKKRLKIPPNFCKHIPWEASRKAKTLKEASMAATLEGPSGRTWLVVIRRSAEGTFFASGWPKFVQDQELRELEFLVFRYDGNTHFTAMVFDTTACEREDLIGGEPPSRGKKRRRQTTTASSEAKRVSKDSVGKELVPYRAPGDKELQVACSEWTPESGKLPVKTEIQDADELALCVMIPAAPTRSSPGTEDGAEKRRAVKLKTRSIHDDLQALADIPASVRRYKGYVSRRRPVTGAERQRAMELAYAFRSSLPYCVIRMSTMHVYYSFMMRFPTGFSRQHLPRERTDVVLRDPGGKAWVVLYIPNTRDRLSRGWCAFARGNCLEEGDYCVFELVGAAEFRVHIFRVVEPAVPAVRLRSA
ncbi:B3 domain-containing protein Os01g0723500-like [Phragmites australis]|uniref:B3 domain-containing protein Os01g0723500-like n=1 Tax=Phragmites australis TaxID=29695 RepID=UPI002D76A028|nr:B3 domain-containing protein Os01g0723500-like [Phragmites australis]